MERRTFHSTPSSSAARERLDEPTYAVSKSVLRRNSHALACRRVRWRVVLDLDLGAELATSRSSASRSVAPM